MIEDKLMNSELEKTGPIIATVPILVEADRETVYKRVGGRISILHEDGKVPDIVLPKGMWQLQIVAVRLPYDPDDPFGTGEKHG